MLGYSLGMALKLFFIQDSPYFYHYRSLKAQDNYCELPLSINIGDIVADDCLLS